MLQRDGLDLTWEPGPGESERQICQRLALYAQAFASTRLEGSRHKGEIASATKNQRLAILSSFYQFAYKRGFITLGNPIDLVDRSPVQPYAKAQGLEQEEVQERLLKIDVSTRPGLREIALLLVLFTTGRRAGEVASLRRRHLQVNRRGIVTLDFERLKSVKSTHDTLDEVVSTVLVLWIQTAYNKPIKDIGAEAVVWMDLAHPTRAEEPLGYQGIAGVCRHYLDTFKVHTTRHSFALLMQAIGAKLTDIQKPLLHSSAATTGLYLETITRNQNQFIGKLTALLGVSGMMAKLFAPAATGE
ncbi:MAG: tyrosine-type recombinase/integrase [Ktedonobacteraceae bacterium]